MATAGLNTCSVPALCNCACTIYRNVCIKCNCSSTHAAENVGIQAQTRSHAALHPTRFNFHSRSATMEKPFGRSRAYPFQTLRSGTDCIFTILIEAVIVCRFQEILWISCRRVASQAPPIAKTKVSNFLPHSHLLRAAAVQRAAGSTPPIKKLAGS